MNNLLKRLRTESIHNAGCMFVREQAADKIEWLQAKAHEELKKTVAYQQQILEQLDEIAQLKEQVAEAAEEKGQ